MSCGAAGVCALAATRKLGAEAAALEWEMRWLPLRRGRRVPDRNAPANDPALHGIAAELTWHRPCISRNFGRFRRAAARAITRCSALSAYQRHAIGLATISGEADWSEQAGLTWSCPPFSLGGGKLITFSLRFGTAKTRGEARAALVTQYAAFAGPLLHPLDTVPALDPAATVARLTAPEAYRRAGHGAAVSEAARARGRDGKLLRRLPARTGGGA